MARESHWTIEALKEHYDERLDRDEAEMIRRFDGFPQEYATKNDHEKIELALATIGSDHVHRREFSDLKKQVDETGGGRRTLYALAAAIIAVIAIAVTVATRNSLTRGEVSNQIQNEAPWVKDRPQVEARIQRLENQVAVLQTRLSQIQQLNRFFCRTRTPKLPPC